MKNSLIPCFLVATSPMAAIFPAAGLLEEDRLAKRAVATSQRLNTPSLPFDPNPAAHFTLHQQVIEQELSLQGWWPWRVQDHQAGFNQISVYRQDQQVTLSMGIGQRHRWSKGWGGGYNLFYDQDLRQNHRRVGLGAELWCSDFKLTANHYFPISSWRNSQQVKTHQVSPAKGFDVILQGYLPRYPAWGAEIRYERYWGAAVARISHSERYKNPQALTLGLNYTPLPLVTLNYNYQITEQRQRHHQLGMAITYRFNIPLAQQLDPQQINVIRAADRPYWEGSVRRHNPLVLHYRELPKKGAIYAALRTAQNTVGEAEAEETIDPDDELESALDQKSDLEDEFDSADDSGESGSDSATPTTGFSGQSSPLGAYHEGSQAPRRLAAASSVVKPVVEELKKNQPVYAKRKAAIKAELAGQLQQLRVHKKINRDPNRPNASKGVKRALRQLAKRQPDLYDRLWVNAQQEHQMGLNYAAGGYSTELFNSAFDQEDQRRKNIVKRFRAEKRQLLQKNDLAGLQELQQRQSESIRKWSRASQ